MMDIVKKNLISIICGVIALAAIGVAFTVLTGKKSELETELAARKSAHDQLASLLSKQRELPTVDPDKPAAEKLSKFPSQKIIDQGDAIVKQVETESKAMLDAAVKMNKHEPLEPGSLPEPTATAAFNFRERYQQFFPPANVNPMQSLLVQALSAGMPPSPDDLRLKIEEKAKDIRTKKLFFTPSGAPANEPLVTAEINEMARKLPEQIRAEIANQKKVYVNPTTFTPYPPILQASGAPDVIDIYLAQVSLWLQQDVIAAVNDANKNSTNIKDAVVKHLVRVTTGSPAPNYVLPASGTPAADPDAAVPKEPALSPTGRVSNGMYDVFHIQVEADVDAARMPEFLRALGRNRFMTPLWADVKSVDNALEMAAGRDYGNVPVVNAKVTVEVLYLRAWNKPLIPIKIKEKLGLTADGAAAPAATPADPNAAPPG